MNTYETVKLRIMNLCDEKSMSIHKLAMESGIAPSTIKNILYGKSVNPGIVTIKMLCDGFGISIVEFFDTEEFKSLEQEIK
ncbi:MAG: helix-turn-helix transcriptional regulator [Clostridia bacterium]|nr:helix-turn-helix transcriptional regulator [Clostridia bacterium]